VNDLHRLVHALHARHERRDAQLIGHPRHLAQRERVGEVALHPHLQELRCSELLRQETIRQRGRAVRVEE
jgi:hypothetical protein